jgi:hypothetical protein
VGWDTAAHLREIDLQTGGYLRIVSGGPIRLTDTTPTLE